MVAAYLVGSGGIASLIFVGLQIKDNSKAVRATAQAVHDNAASSYMTLAMTKPLGMYERKLQPKFDVTVRYGVVYCVFMKGFLESCGGGYEM